MKVTKYRMLMLCFLSLSLTAFVVYYDEIDFWAVDVLSNFTVQFACLSLIIFFLCFWKNKPISTALFGFIFIFNASVMLNSSLSAHAVRQPAKSFKVYSANVHYSNPDLSQLLSEVKKEDADILLILEVATNHLDQLKPLFRQYTYNVSCPSIEIDGRGMILLSRFPVLRYNVRKLSDFGNALIAAEMEINNKAVKFFGAHFLRPDDYLHSRDRKDHFIELANQIAGESLPAIAAGDFNETPYTPVFRKFVKMSGLKDSREGQGWQPSWPTYFPPLWIPIDHVLVTPDIQVLDRKTGSYIGSDHYPVIAELSLN